MLNHVVISNLHHNDVAVVRFLLLVLCIFLHSVCQPTNGLNKIRFMISTKILQVSAPRRHPQKPTRTKEQKSKTLIRVPRLAFWNCFPYHELYFMVCILLNIVSTFADIYSEYNEYCGGEKADLTFRNRASYI
jgi:hypothetical protein